MPTIEQSAIVPHSVEEMFILVNDIGQYKEFVPYCVESVIHSVSGDEIQASLTLSASGFKKQFTTCNQLSPYSTIHLTLVEGPFKAFSGAWHFRATKTGETEVKLVLNFEFSSRLMHTLFGPVFSKVSHKLVDAFVARAEAVYTA